MSWHTFLDIGTPLVFNPKVVPDPTAAEQLDEKFQHAMRLLKKDFQRAYNHTYVAAKLARTSPLLQVDSMTADG